MMATTAEIDQRCITLAGGPVMYRELGEGPPVILLHGWGGSSRYWQATMRALGHERRVIALDFPGYGASPPQPGRGSHVGQASLVIEVADALGLGQFDLNGHSFGAATGIMLAARHPQRVRRLILTCFSTWRNERERQIVDQVHRVMALWLRLRAGWQLRAPWFYRLASRRFFYRAPADASVLQAHFRDFLEMDAAAALEAARDAANPIIDAAMTAIQSPTLLIAARQDAIMPPYGSPEAARRIPGCGLAWIDCCGHLPMVERPDAYHPLVTAFLA